MVGQAKEEGLPEELQLLALRGHLIGVHLTLLRTLLQLYIGLLMGHLLEDMEIQQ